MPFRSQAQARYLFAKHPAIAKEFASKTPSIKALPNKVKHKMAKVEYDKIEKNRGKMGKKRKNFIAGAIKHPGALHRELGVPKGTKIPAGKLAAAAKKGGTEGRRARLAQTLKGFHHRGKKIY